LGKSSNLVRKTIEGNLANMNVISGLFIHLRPYIMVDSFYLEDNAWDVKGFHEVEKELRIEIDNYLSQNEVKEEVELSTDTIDLSQVEIDSDISYEEYMKEFNTKVQGLVV
jgi:hypothetical protein